MSSDDTTGGALLRAEAARRSHRVVQQHTPLEVVMGAAAQGRDRDAATLRAMVSGTLRWHHRLQWQLASLLDRPLRPRDALLGTLIRVGLFQLQWLRVPDHAAVAATVGAAPILGYARARGVVNAVLRRFLRERAELDAAMARDREAVASHPQWLLQRLQSDWPDRWQAIVAANNELPPMWLRINRRRVEPSAYVRMLERAGLAFEPVEDSDVAVRLVEPVATSRLPGWSEGLVSVQDAAAQLAARLLELGSGMRVLDACAAPGGKTAHLLESCAGLDEVVAIDRSPDRLTTLEANLYRLGLSATVVAADATEPATWWDGRPFDRILLDAPCSATGVIRRHPDIKVLRKPSDIDTVAALQRRLLSALWPLLAPGGRLLYATCSVLRAENQQLIARYAGDSAAVPGASVRVSTERQILPGEANMDGFYYACLDRIDSL